MKQHYVGGRARGHLRWLALAVSLAATGAACGSDDDGSSSATSAAQETAAADAAETSAASAGAGVDSTAPANDSDDPVAAGLARAQEIADAANVPPTEIGPTIPLTSAPEARTVGWLECELPACQEITPGFEAATAALGWELQVITVESFNPGPGMQQAIDAGVDYIAITGSPRAIYEEQLANARAAGIPVMECYATDEPDFDAGLYMMCSDSRNAGDAGAKLANWAIADSGGDAHTLMVNIPDFPILAAEEEGAKAAYEENCPNCTFEPLNVTIDQFAAGEIPAAIVSALQNDESINYIHFAFGDLPLSVTDTLREAGLLDRVNQVGVDFSLGVGLNEIIAGTHAGWTTNPKPYAAWLMVDAMARDAVGMDNPQERDNALLPLFIVSDAATAEQYKDSAWPGPEGYEDQFKALWGVD